MPHHRRTPRIETKHLILRQFTMEDSSGIRMRWIADPRVQVSYGRASYTTEGQAAWWLERVLEGYTRQGYYRWAIDEKTGCKNIGQIAFHKIRDECAAAELECAIGRAFQGQGYGVEAVRAVLRFGFEQIGFHKIEASHRATNSAARRTAEKCGFVHEGTKRDDILVDNQYIGRVCYSLLADEWAAARESRRIRNTSPPPDYI